VIDVGKEVAVPRGAIKLTKNTLKALMQRFGLQKKDVSVYFCDERTIMDLNSQYRFNDAPTDVLSFAGEDDFLGEIIICVPVALRQAQESNVGWQVEFAMLLIHSFLHLLGYDDETEEGYNEMVSIQNQILKEFGYEESAINRLLPDSR
jgi:probable rRNA maturation factor